MEYRLVIKTLAQLDITEAVEWYSIHAEHLTVRFVGEIEKALNEIQKNPKHFQKRYNEIRIIFTENYPYGIYYTIEGDKIFIHAILHTKRNPQTGIERI